MKSLPEPVTVREAKAPTSYSWMSSDTSRKKLGQQLNRLPLQWVTRLKHMFAATPVMRLAMCLMTSEIKPFHIHRRL